MTKSSAKKILKKLALLLGLSLPTLLLSLLLVEIMLRLLIPVADRPAYRFDNEAGLMTLRPYERGTFTLGVWGEVLSADFTINNAGWNAPRDYVAEKSPDTLRIAIIGDSFIEALQVEQSESVSGRLETLLNGESKRVEVYSFGISGAPLSNYLLMMRYAAERYAPDLFIINIVENDFETSLAHVYPTPHFLQYTFDSAGNLIEIPPTDPEPSFLRRNLRRFALVRYFYYNLQVTTLEELRERLRPRTPSGERIDMAAMPPVTLADADPEIVTMVDYTLGQMRQISAQADAELLLVIDAFRPAYYDNLSQQIIENHPLFLNNRIVREAATEHEIELLELVYSFKASFETYGDYLDFYPDDPHWNKLGHGLVAQYIVARLTENGWLE